MHFAYGVVGVFIAMGVLIGVISLTISWLVRPSNPTPEKQMIYECGEVPEGTPWLQFNNRFYTVALVFLLFDVEVVFLFPWAVVFKELGAFAFVEMFVFVAILLVGLAYAWVKGDLEWVRSKSRFAIESATELKKGQAA
jgi:NADH-quinone oxidoreductase subunit A